MEVDNICKEINDEILDESKLYQLLENFLENDFKQHRVNARQCP
jgi:hypothetical protein